MGMAVDLGVTSEFMEGTFNVRRFTINEIRTFYHRWS